MTSSELAVLTTKTFGGGIPAILKTRNTGLDFLQPASSQVRRWRVCVLWGVGQMDTAKSTGLEQSGPFASVQS